MLKLNNSLFLIFEREGSFETERIATDHPKFLLLEDVTIAVIISASTSTGNLVPATYVFVVQPLHIVFQRQI
jgi:hypothetical protein